MTTHKQPRSRAADLETPIFVMSVRTRATRSASTSNPLLKAGARTRALLVFHQLLAMPGRLVSAFQQSEVQCLLWWPILLRTHVDIICSATACYSK